PPDALRMSPQSPSSAGPERDAGGLPEKSRKTTNLLIRRRPGRSSGPAPEPNQHRLNWGTVCGRPPCSPYSELGLVLPSKTPARRESVETSAFAATAKRKLA